VAFDTSANRATSCIVARRAQRSVIGVGSDDRLHGRRRTNLNASERVQRPTSMAPKPRAVKRGAGRGARGAGRGARGAGRGARGEANRLVLKWNASGCGIGHR
jgi:hypothetical protein